VTTGRRNVSTVAPQALFMLNHPFVQEQAAAAAARLLRDGRPTDAARADAAYRSVLGRAPTGRRARSGAAARRRSTAGADESSEGAAWAGIFHALFASPEFPVRD
jgi:hypothetical protein